MNAPTNVLSSLFEHSLEDLMALVPHVIGAIVVLIVGYIAAKVLSHAAARLVRKARGARAGSLAPIVRGTVFVTVAGIGLVTALGQLGINLAALVAGAGVLGLAVGFGAQTLVKDCLAGFFLVMDDVVAEGDAVTIDGVTGTVERVGLRVTQLRSYEGQLWYVPNGEIKLVGNWHREWLRAIVEISIAYEQDVERGMAALRGVGVAWAEEHPELTLGPPEVQGIMKLNSSDVTIRLVVKIKGELVKLRESERELRRRAKDAFDRQGVEIPFARTVVYHRQEPEARLRANADRPAPPAS